MCEKIVRLVKQIITDLTYIHECFNEVKKEMLKDILNECKQKTKK
jgi:hypothetical protein